MFVPGWWKSEHGIIGDHPASILTIAFQAIENYYLTHAGRLPTQGEMSNIIEFVSKGTLVAACGHPNFSFAVNNNDEDVPRVNDIGNQGALSKYASPEEGKIVNVNPKTGENYSLNDLNESNTVDDLKGVVNYILDKDNLNFDNVKFWEFIELYRQMAFLNKYESYKRMRSQFNEILSKKYAEIKEIYKNKLSKLNDSKIDLNIFIDNLPLLGEHIYDYINNNNFELDDLINEIKLTLNKIGYEDKYNFIISEYCDHERILLNEQQNF